MVHAEKRANKMNDRQLKNLTANMSAPSRLIYNKNKEIVGIEIPARRTCANVPHTVYITLESLRKQFGNDESSAFYGIRAMQRSKLLPRMGSMDHPLKERDFELYKRNRAVGKRLWQWIQANGQNVRESTGYDCVWGYGYYTDTGFVIVNQDDSPRFVVKNKCGL